MSVSWPLTPPTPYLFVASLQQWIIFKSSGYFYLRDRICLSKAFLVVWDLLLDLFSTSICCFPCALIDLTINYTYRVSNFNDKSWYVIHCQSVHLNVEPYDNWVFFLSSVVTESGFSSECQILKIQAWEKYYNARLRIRNEKYFCFKLAWAVLWLLSIRKKRWKCLQLKVFDYSYFHILWCSSSSTILNLSSQSGPFLLFSVLKLPVAQKRRGRGNKRVKTMDYVLLIFILMGCFLLCPVSTISYWIC